MSTNPLPVSHDKAGLRPAKRMRIGALYWVTFVKLKTPSYGSCWRPILGPLHTDAEIIGFSHEHWHIDWRFMSDRFVDSMTLFKGGDHRYCHGNVATHRHQNGDAIYDDGLLYRRRVKCRRTMPGFVPTEKVRWQADLEAAMIAQKKRMRCMTCPHRGVPLLEEMTDAKGVVTCQAHGLKWRVKTGRLVRTPKGKLQKKGTAA